MYGCTINSPKTFNFIENKIDNKVIDFYSNGTIITGKKPTILNKEESSKFNCDF